MLAFNSLGIECKTRDIMMQLCKNFDQAAIGRFCTVLVVSLQTYLEALESLQVFTRILPGSVGISYKVGQTQNVFSGVSQVEGKADGNK